MRNLIHSLVCSLLVLSSALAHAATLESPAPGANVSGLGYIAGWKCHHGDITVRIDGGGPIRVATRMPRADTQAVCQGATDNGFITQFNWAFLADGSHTVVAYDNGVEFARRTFTVATDALGVAARPATGRKLDINTILSDALDGHFGLIWRGEGPI